MPPICRPRPARRAAIHHDAGIGRDEAGVGGLAYAEKLGMAMAAVATGSARIGDGAGHVRARPHQPCQCAGRGLRRARRPELRGGRRAAEDGAVAARQAARRWAKTPHVVAGFVLCVDSLSLPMPQDRGHRRHRQPWRLNFGRGRRAVPAAAGPLQRCRLRRRHAGMAGLAILDRAGIAGATVAAHVGPHRRRPLDLAGRNSLGGQRSRIPARRAVWAAPPLPWPAPWPKKLG